jgi:hypothetical protein
MNTDTIIVTVGIAIISTIAAYIKIKIGKFENKYGAAIEQIDAKFKQEVGEQQYNKDVDIIKAALNELSVDKKSITIEVATMLIKQLHTKVNFNESEILDIINKIVQGVL